MITNSYKIAVASDLHVESASTAPAKAHSSLNVSGRSNSSGLNAIDELLGIVRRSRTGADPIIADVLLCPGDMGHNANPEGARFAWRLLGDLSRELSSTHLLATVGNHDVDYKHQYDTHDAWNTLKSLDPVFPTGHQADADKYFNRQYVIVNHPPARIVIVNSCAFHDAGKSYAECGYIKPQTINAIKTELAAAPESNINILLCHHHPQLHSEFGLGERDVMAQGQILLDVLGTGEYGPWLVIHGHKHHPKLNYSAGGVLSAVVLASASLSAGPYLDIVSSTRNQFHLISVDISQVSSRALKGTVKSWSWHEGQGWITSVSRPGLPPVCGFGFRGSVYSLAAAIAGSLSEPFLRWDELISRHPDVAFLLPVDQAALIRELKRLGLKVSEADGMPFELGKF